MSFYQALSPRFKVQVSNQSYSNQSTDLQSESMDLFLYDSDLLHERVNPFQVIASFLYSRKSFGFLMFSADMEMEYGSEMHCLTINAGSSPLQSANSQTRTGNVWFPSASR